MVANTAGALSWDALYLLSPAQSILFYFQWPVPTDSSTAQGLLEPLWHTRRNLSMSCSPKAALSQSPIAVGIWKPSCLALKPGHSLRYTSHSRFHCLLTLRLGFCLKSWLCLASFPSGPASPLPYQLLLGACPHTLACQDLLQGNPA